MANINKIKEIRILADSIGEAGIEQQLLFKEKALDDVLSCEDVKASKPLGVDYILTREGDTIHASVTLKGQIRAQCASCLEQVFFPVDMTLHTDYLTASDDMQGDLEALRQSSEIGYYRKEIELGTFIISEMILSLPMRYKCSNDCKGLCPECGANLNKEKCSCEKKLEDPRLEKLLTLKSKLRRK